MNGISPHKVAILYNKDVQVTRGDPQDLLAIQCTITAAQNLSKALSSLGYQVAKIPVRGSSRRTRRQASFFFSERNIHIQ